MNELGLFAGAGGGLLASQHLLGHRTVCYVERDPYCIDVLKARIRDGVLDDAPIDDDVRTFDGKPWRGKVDIVSAGFPCQPFSIAGKQQADLDERNLWPDTVRIIREVRPAWILLENVPGLLCVRRQLGYRMVRMGTLVAAYEDILILPSYFGRILSDLAESRFDVAWKVLSAAEVGAPHKRDRLWLVGRNTDCGQQMSQREVRGGAVAVAGGIGNVAHADLRRCVRSNQTQATESDLYVKAGHTPSVWWETEPAVGRVADGVAHRVDRLRAIGNGQVPLVAATAWRLLTTESTED